MSALSKDIQNISLNQLDDYEARWFAIYTKFKCEKYVVAHLEKKKIEAYLPLITKTRRYNRKIKQRKVPLINCYIFVKIRRPEYLTVLETEYVMKFLRQGKDLLAIPEKEMDMLKRVVGDVEETFALTDHQFHLGDEVEVHSGHLTGMKGRIMSKSGKKCFVVELETIGFQLRVNMDLSLLRPVHNMKHNT